jgi:hypothetical protein
VVVRENAERKIDANGKKNGATEGEVMDTGRGTLLQQMSVI